MICNDCGTEKIRLRDYACKECRRIYLKEWYQRNRKAHDETSKKWVVENKERRKEISKKYDDKTSSKEAKSIRKKEDYLNNKEKYREWSKNADPVKMRAAKNRRRARIRGNGFIKYDRNLIFERDNNTCAYCGKLGTHLDHIQSIFKGGADIPDNVTVACQPCNFSKGPKIATEFMLPKFKKIKLQLDTLWPN